MSTLSLPRVNDLYRFIVARHRIYLARSAGKPKPWTDDPILQQYRFCNVYRELDTVTQWITNNWRGPHRDDPDVWFAMAVARLVNWPETLAEVGYPVPWKPAQFIRLLEARRERKAKVFTGAYIVHAEVSVGGAPVKFTSKAAYLADTVLTPLWVARKQVRPRAGDSLETFFNRLSTFRDMGGGFLSGQIIADTKYTPPLIAADDWWSWAVTGPGSARGMNRICERPPTERWQRPNGYAPEWNERLLELQAIINQKIVQGQPGWDPLHAQDVQNCLCEFDKYERARLGEGRPRTSYPGTPETLPLL